MPYTTNQKLKDLLPPAQIDPSPRPQTQMTFIDTLVHKMKEMANPVTGRVRHWMNDPIAQAQQALFVGGPLIFAGPKAATANIPKLNQAKQMAKSGEGRDKIWNDTGWFKDIDNKWKFEIDDSMASVLPKKERHNYPQLPGRRPTPEQEYVFETTSDVLRHDDLYKNYPEVAKYETSYGYGAPTGGASFSPKDKVIKNNAFARDDQYLSNQLHELQHGIQEIEGFGRGGSLKVGASIGHDANKWRTPAQRIAKAAAQLRRWGGSYPKIAKKILSELPDNQQKRAIRWSKSKNFTQKSLDQLAGDMDFEAYRRLSGEAEARNVQTRSALKPDMRRILPPWETLDVPQDQLILIKRDIPFGGK